MIPETRSSPSVVAVGTGFAGCRILERLLPPDTAELTVISATDHLYALPAAGNRLRVATSWAVKGDQR
jgi:hypothetical protein